MQNSLFILGRQSALANAELESLYSSEALVAVSKHASIVKTNPQSINFSQIGGSIKLASVLTVLPYSDWRKITAYLEKMLPKHVVSIPSGKLKLGVSTYDINVNVSQIQRSALQIKKAIKRTGRSIRVIPNVTTALNSAQVLNNKLTSDTGLEIVCVRNGSRTIVAQTIAEQDIDNYADRDQRRPMRDAKVGMLPPKLAQIIINIATAKSISGTTVDPVHIVLDPFCGTGVILQEAGLMGYAVYGSDIEDRMIEYSQKNLQWLKEQRTLALDWSLEVGDATNHTWSKPFHTIACETYLGRPFSTLPDVATLEKVMTDVNLILKRFLQNVARQTEKDFRLAIAVPSWKTPTGFRHLKLLDSLESLGYTRQSFVHVRDQELIYHRDGQIVARELVVLKRT